MGHELYQMSIYPIAQIIEFSFTFFRKLFDSSAVAIVGTGFIMGMLMLPLLIAAEYWQSVEQKTAKLLSQNAVRIKTAFKGSERRRLLTTYYKQNHYCPIMILRRFAVSAILLLFFAAAYTYFPNAGVLQGKQFLFIHNMEVPDRLFKAGASSVNVLPFIFASLCLVAGIIYTKGRSLYDKLQIYGLSLFLFMLLYRSPAGLVLYSIACVCLLLIKNIFSRLKQPVKLLYGILCLTVAVFTIRILAGRILSAKEAILVCGAASIVYFIPLIIRLFNWLAARVFSGLTDTPKKRFVLFITSTLGVWLLSGLLLPTLLIASSPMEFCGIDSYANPLFFVINTLLQSAGFCLVWPLLFYALFLHHKKIQTLAAVFFAMLLPCAIVNAVLFPGSYGTLSKLLVFTQTSSLEPSIPQTVLNFGVLAVVSLIVLFFCSRQPGQLATVIVFALIALTGVSASNIWTINAGYRKYKKIAAASNTEKKQLKPIFHFSRTGKNVLMIYLDRAENRFVQTIFNESPELYEQYSGFTLFSNTISCNAHTLMGAPECYGGYEYMPEAINKRSNELLVDKQNEALLLLPRIFTEQIKGYSATVTDPSWANYSWIPDLSIYHTYPQIKPYLTDSVYLDLWYKEHTDTAKITVISETLKRNMLWYSLFRQVPLIFRSAVYLQGTYWSSNKSVDDFDSFLKAYSVLDYLPRLTDFKATKPNTFTCFVNNTTHDNLWLQAPDYVPVAHVTNRGNTRYADVASYATNAGSLKRVGTWFQILKDNGVYDNTRIVIVADHSCTSSEREGYKWSPKFDKIGPGRYHPLLMYKDFGSEGRLVINHDFMANADVPTLLTHGVIKNPVNPFTHKQVNSDAKKKGLLVCTDTIFMPYQTKSKYVFTARPDSWWRVKNNIFDPENWKQEIHKWE